MPKEEHSAARRAPMLAAPATLTPDQRANRISLCQIALLFSKNPSTIPIAVAPSTVALATSPQAAGPAKMRAGACILNWGKSFARLGPAKSTFTLQAPGTAEGPSTKPESGDRAEGFEGRGSAHARL